MPDTPRRVLRDIQVTAAEAATEVGMTPATIAKWVQRGHLTPIPGSGRPRKFWLADVFAAEKTRARQMRRPRPSATIASSPPH